MELIQVCNGHVGYLDPREGWSQSLWGVAVEDWELSRRSKVEISGDDSEEPRTDTRDSCDAMLCILVCVY